MLDTRRGGSFAEWSSGEGDGVVSVPVPARPASLRRRILYATPEMADFLKTGGLGEVSAALPRALVPHYDIRVLIPGYRQVARGSPEFGGRRLRASRGFRLGTRLVKRPRPGI